MTFYNWGTVLQMADTISTGSYRWTHARQYVYVCMQYYSTCTYANWRGSFEHQSWQKGLAYKWRLRIRDGHREHIGKIIFFYLNRVICVYIYIYICVFLFNFLFIAKNFLQTSFKNFFLRQSLDHRSQIISLILIAK